MNSIKYVEIVLEPVEPLELHKGKLPAVEIRDSCRYVAPRCCCDSQPFECVADCRDIIQRGVDLYVQGQEVCAKATNQPGAVYERSGMQEVFLPAGFKVRFRQ